MAYDNSSISMHAVRQLADVSGPYPIKCRHITLAAERFGFGGRVIAFLNQFDPQEVFSSRGDFIQRCRELKLERHARRSSLLRHLRHEGVATKA